MERSDIYVSHIHKAVMEEQAEDRGSDPKLSINRLPHRDTHDASEVRASCGVEIGRELRIGKARKLQ